MGYLATYDKLKDVDLESICNILGDTDTGLTGTQIGTFLSQSHITDVALTSAKRYRLFDALRAKQNEDNCSNNVLHFIQVVMEPQRYIQTPELFSNRRRDLNHALAFAGYEICEDGKLRRLASAATTLKDVIDMQESVQNVSSVFKNRNFKPDPKLIFLIIPLNPAFKRIYDLNVTTALRRIGFDAKSIDTDMRTGMIIEQIWEAICKSRAVIADVTGKNPNVFYELGLAHAIGKECIIMTQNDSDVPFDIRHLRYLKYSDNEEGWKKLENDLCEFIISLDKNS